MVDEREFIAFDGEGITYEENRPAKLMGVFWDLDTHKIVWGYEGTPQTYVLLANSKGERIIDGNGLSTVDCLEFILETKRRYPKSIFVGYGFNYDVNQILKDLSRGRLQKLHKVNLVRYGKYFLVWNPGKEFVIKDMESDRPVAVIYDAFSFFQKSFLETCKDYLGENDPRLKQIEEGKSSRETFDWKEIDTKIIPYNNRELEMFVEFMNILRTEFKSLGIHVTYWYGPGAAVDKLFKLKKIPISRKVPNEVLSASQYAYAGGRFELFRMGYYPRPVYEYDINSAYPEALTKLSDISNGSWEHVKRFEPGTFGVWNIRYISTDGDRTNCRPQPLFCRSRDGRISYPRKVQGWYWTPEAELVPSSVKEGWVFRANTNSKPFAFVEEMYRDRKLRKSKGDPVERQLKLLLNSMYGKLAQLVGGKDGPPHWHQLEYAGYVTSYTRAKMYKAIMLNPSSIISAETDAVFSTEPLDLPISEEMGDWKLTVLDEICYLQSGFYYFVKDGERNSKYRGMDRDKENKCPVGLPLDVVLEHLEKETGRWDHTPKALCAFTNRFVGIGIALMTSSVWRSWERSHRLVSLAHSTVKKRRTKRVHIIKECSLCQFNHNMVVTMHPLQIGGYSGKSYPTYVPWLEELNTWSIDWTEFKAKLKEHEAERWS